MTLPTSAIVRTPSGPAQANRRSIEAAEAYATPLGTKISRTSHADINNPVLASASECENALPIKPEKLGAQIIRGDVYDTDVDNIDGSVTNETIDLDKTQPVRTRPWPAKTSQEGEERPRGIEKTVDYREPHASQDGSYDGSDESDDMDPENDPTVTLNADEVTAACQASLTIRNGQGHDAGESYDSSDRPMGDFNWQENGKTRPTREYHMALSSSQFESQGGVRAGQTSGRALELFNVGVYQRRIALRGNGAPVNDGIPSSTGQLRGATRTGLFDASDLTEDDEADEVASEPELQSLPLAHSPSRAGSAPPHAPTGKESCVSKRRAEPEIELDYSPQTLAAMTYEALQAEPFDMHPAAVSSVLPATHVSAPLDHQLSYVANLPPEQQRQFCASLPAAQWDECGDWFVEQFASFVAKRKEARVEKRRVAMAFEEEIREREAKVRRKRQAVEESLKGMKKGGSAVLGKTQ